MASDIIERYKLIVTQHQHTSDDRSKNISGLCVIYGALAAAFAWLQTEGWLGPLSAIIPAVGAGVTLLVWLSDYRLRSGLNICRRIGAEIEKNLLVQGFFVQLEREGKNNDLKEIIRYGTLIDIFLPVMVVLFCVATGYLWGSSGVLPREIDINFTRLVCLVAIFIVLSILGVLFVHRKSKYFLLGVLGVAIFIVLSILVLAGGIVGHLNSKEAVVPITKDMLLMKSAKPCKP